MEELTVSIANTSIVFIPQLESNAGHCCGRQLANDAAL